MLVLGIETSCDETSVAVVEDGRFVKSNVIASSRDAFKSLAGVIPEEAARHQVECMMPVLLKAVRDAGITPKDIDQIAVTKGPGLLGSLLVGTTTARMIASVWKKSLIGVHHTLGHLSSTWLETTDEPQFPMLTLSVSGGHSDIWYRTSYIKGILIGQTRDDAAGEAFDKGASLLGLPYPGGPSIAKESEKGNPQAHMFPRPLHDEEGCDFSFSGLKTSLKYLLRDLRQKNESLTISQTQDIAASFQHSICLHLTDRLEQALKLHPNVQEVHVVGGVSANTHLRSLVANLCTSRRFPVTFRFPAKLSYCTDNAAMIASAGFFLLLEDPAAASQTFATEASLSLKKTVHGK